MKLLENQRNHLNQRITGLIALSAGARVVHSDPVNSAEWQSGIESAQWTSLRALKLVLEAG
jgi:hypothetical protein